MRIAAIIIFCLLKGINGFSQDTYKLIESDEIISEVFEEDDLTSLALILNLYDDWVVSTTGINDIDSAYHVFSDYVEFNKSFEEREMKTKLPQYSLDSIIIHCENSWTFNKLWIYEYGKRPRQIDTLMCTLTPNIWWVYGDFLKKLVNTHPKITDYIKSIEEMHAISPAIYLFPALIHEDLDFGETHWRLFYAIHFVTVNYWVEYKKITN